MKIEDRKKIVARLLSKAKEETEIEADLIRNEKDPSLDFIYEHVRKYVLSKFLLAPDCEETRIRELARLSLARTMKIDPNIMHSLDVATPCDHATSESAKKVLLLFAVQKDFGLAPNPEKLAKVEDLHALAEYVYQAERC